MVKKKNETKINVRRIFEWFKRFNEENIQKISESDSLA